MNNNLVRAGMLGTAFLCVLAAGCAGTPEVVPPPVAKPNISKPLDPPPAGRPSIAPNVVGSAPVAPQAAVEQPISKPAPAAKEAATVKVEPSAPAQKAEVAAAPKSEPKPAAPAKANPKAAPAKSAAAQPARIEPAPQAAPKAESTLDIADLKARLGETKAIGVLTKLALKNQMDDLLERFRAVYRSGQSTVAPLRQPYDALVAKVLAQLRAGDPALARKIEGSREAIWSILSDPEKFRSVS